MEKIALFALPLYALVSLSTATLHAQQPLPQDHPKCVVAGRVFDELISAIGDGRTRPFLRLLAGETKVTWFVPQQIAVNLEVRAYDLCASLGADSLSALARSDPEEKAAARQDFAAAAEGNPSLARLNLSALNGETIAPAVQVSRGQEKSMARGEKIAGISALEYEAVTAAADAIANLPRLDQDRPLVNIYSRQTASWSGWVIDTGLQVITFLETRPGYDGQSAQGVRLGEARTALIATCGPPTRLLSGRQGRYHVYESDRIIFWTGVDDRVQGWLLYESEE